MNFKLLLFILFGLVLAAPALHLEKQSLTARFKKEKQPKNTAGAPEKGKSSPPSAEPAPSTGTSSPATSPKQGENTGTSEQQQSIFGSILNSSNMKIAGGMLGIVIVGALVYKNKDKLQGIMKKFAKK
jgi:hypothetical protein